MPLLRHVSPPRLALVPLLCLALAGCWEVHQRVTVNPDGSARVRVVREISLDAVKQLQMGQQADMEESARSQAAEMVRSARGVEAWADVGWSVEEEVIRVEGTAYVPDLGEFSLSDPGDDDGAAISTLDFRETDSGSVIEMTLGGEEEGGDPLPSLTREEAMEMARELKSESRQMRTMAAGMFIDMREIVSLDLPAEPTEVDGFTRGDDGSWSARFEGEALLSAIGAVAEMSTEELADHLREAASEGRTQDEAMGELMLENLEGIPARLVIPSSGDPRFDYEAEAAAAAESYPELRERLGIGDEEGAGGGDSGGGAPAASEAAVAQPGAGEEAGGGAPRRAPDVDPGPAPRRVDGPPEAVRLEIGRAGASSSLEVGTSLVVTVPALAGERHLGLATDGPEGIAVVDDSGRDLVAASGEAFRAWQEANPNTMTSRTSASWSLGSTRGDPEVPTLEIELWATPGPGARSLRVQGEVPVLGLPEETETATVPPGEVADGGELALGGRRVTLSRYATMTRGDVRSAIYEIQGDVIVTAVRRGGETLWQLGDGTDTRITVPEELSGTEPVEFTFGEPSVRRVPLDLRFGLGLHRLDAGGR